MPEYKTCKFCGATIIWGEKERDWNIPLEPLHPTYELTDDGKLIPSKAMVSHKFLCTGKDKPDSWKPKDQPHLSQRNL